MCMEYQKGAEPPAGVTIYRVPFGKMTYKEFKELYPYPVHGIPQYRSKNKFK